MSSATADHRGPPSGRLHDELVDLALATFETCHARDYTRVDIRIDSSDRPFVLEINSMASLGMNGSFVRAALESGMSFRDLTTSSWNVDPAGLARRSGRDAEPRLKCR